MLPMSPTYAPSEPFLEIGRLELLTEQTSPLHEDLLKAEDTIFRRDRIDPKVHDSRVRCVLAYELQSGHCS